MAATSQEFLHQLSSSSLVTIPSQTDDTRQTETSESQDNNSSRNQLCDSPEAASSDGVLDVPVRNTTTRPSLNRSWDPLSQLLSRLTDQEDTIHTAILGWLILVILICILMFATAYREGRSRILLDVITRCNALAPHFCFSLCHYFILLPIVSFIFRQWRAQRRAIFSISLLLLLEGLLLWAYYVLLNRLAQVSLARDDFDRDMYNTEFGAWMTGYRPQTFHGCQHRVLPQQALLFREKYWVQFPRMYTSFNESATWSGYSEESFIAVRNNSTLCSQGFEANGDLYGLGIRLGIYLQWLAALFSNQLLPGNRKGIQNTYLIFNVSICAATIVSTFTKCTFGIEAQILYWFYWGGAICVFASSPNQTRLGTETKWIQLDWSTGIQYCTHLLMASHGLWYLHYAYDQVFARMPCGTEQFFPFPITDPSITYCYVRDTLTMLFMPLTMVFLVHFPFIFLCLTSEIWESVKGSYILQRLFADHTDSSAANVNIADRSNIARPSPVFGVGLLDRAKRILLHLRSNLRLLFHFPEQPIHGIRLITPLDIQDRRNYRIRCAVLGVAAFILCIWAVEATLKWNKIVGIYSISSTGQYIAFIMGLGPFSSVMWELLQQETQRRQAISRRLAVNDDVELTDFPATLSGALQHAAAQPDVEFYMSGGLGLGSASSSVYFDALSARTSLNIGRDRNRDGEDSDELSHDTHSSAV